ncbi:MAG: hypothetical protein RX316_01805 [bacterium]|nr:hypothetical protein [bacterium]
MKRTSLVFLTVLMVSAWAVSGVSAQTLSPRTHIYNIEYLKSPPGVKNHRLGIQGAHVLKVIFLRKVSGKKAEVVLRSEMAVINTLFPPEGDILAAAWKRLIEDPAGDEIIYLTDGSCHLIYSKKENKIILSKEHLGIH